MRVDDEHDALFVRVDLAEPGKDRIVARGGAGGYLRAEGDVADQGGGTREGGCGCRIVDYYQLPTLPA